MQRLKIWAENVKRSFLALGFQIPLRTQHTPISRMDSASATSNLAYYVHVLYENKA